MRDLEAIALLEDAARRALYEYVASCGREVSRNEAAEATGLQRTLAAFHLDRLASAGLLEVSYRRLGERSGPGAGRPAKLYRRASAERAVSVPPREYLRAAQAFAEAIERSGAETTLYAVARQRGVTVGQALGTVSPRRSGDAPYKETDTLADLVRYLGERGYAPYLANAEMADDEIRLANCPFHALAREYPVVSCGMNLALLEGVLDGAGLTSSCRARLDPRPGECCVAIASKTNED